MKKTISLLIALALLPALLLPVACKKTEPGKGNDPEAGAAGTTPASRQGNASGRENGAETDVETVLYAFIDAAVSLFEDGATPADVLADYFNGTAGATLSAMRLAVDCLLELKGAALPKENRPDDWDQIASLGWASPYPYVFEGIVHEAKGDFDAALSCYEKASYNPMLPEESVYLKLMADLDVNQLQGLRKKLTEIEDMYFASYPRANHGIPRSEFNYSSSYLRLQGLEVLKENPDALHSALGYYFAALRANPFDGDTYAVIVMLYVYLNDSEEASYWLVLGRLLDPENGALIKIHETIKGASR